MKIDFSDFGRKISDLCKSARTSVIPLLIILAFMALWICGILSASDSPVAVSGAAGTRPITSTVSEAWGYTNSSSSNAEGLAGFWKGVVLLFLAPIGLWTLFYVRRVEKDVCALEAQQRSVGTRHYGEEDLEEGPCVLILLNGETEDGPPPPRRHT